MSNHNIQGSSDQAGSVWLKRYYFARFAVAAAWVGTAFTLAAHLPLLAAAMLIAYPAWDAVANLADARRSGGLAQNKPQRLNFIVSSLTAVAVGAALHWGMHAVLAVFGVWATVSGLCQLAAAIRRRKAVQGQWSMMLSGAQSGLAGAFMLHMALGEDAVTIANVAPYAAFGAFYFLVSALWLVISDARRRGPRAA